MLKSDEAACERVRQAMVSGLPTRRYEDVVKDGLEAVGLSKSSVSRKFVKASSSQLKKLMERPVPKDVIAVLLDGTDIGGHMVVTAVGIDSGGGKHSLGVASGTTENKSVCGDLLRSLVNRGLDIEGRLLFVLDGGKALESAVREVCGSHHEMQRCREHKKRNVTDRLPESKKAYVRSAMTAAYKLPHQQGVQKMKQLASELRPSHPDAANSLLEGLDETFTVNRLALPPILISSLGTTNMIENTHGAIQTAVARFKRVANQQDAARLAASALLSAERNFRTLKGHKQLWMLEAALGRFTQAKTA